MESDPVPPWQGGGICLVAFNYSGPVPARLTRQAVKQPLQVFFPIIPAVMVKPERKETRKRVLKLLGHAINNHPHGIAACGI